MSLHWHACIYINTYCYEIYHISLETVLWALSNASFIMQIYPAIHEILANEAFIITDDLISWLFVVAFVHPTYIQVALIWGFPLQLSLWKSVHWLWRYKLNEVCDRLLIWTLFLETFFLPFLVTQLLKNTSLQIANSLKTPKVFFALITKFIYYFLVISIHIFSSIIMIISLLATSVRTKHLN